MTIEPHQLLIFLAGIAAFALLARRRRRKPPAAPKACEPPLYAIPAPEPATKPLEAVAIKVVPRLHKERPMDMRVSDPIDDPDFRGWSGKERM